LRERLLSDVRARLERFAVAQDQAVVLDPVALDEVVTLLDAAPDPGADLEVAYVAGSLHWCRFAFLGNDQADLAAALTLLEPVYRAQPDLVPGLAGDYLDAGGPAVAAELRTRAERAGRLLQDASSTGDRAGLGQVIDLLRHTLATAPAHHPDRAGMLSNLGIALRARFEQTGARADLDAAIAAGQEAADTIPAGHPDQATVLSNLGNALRARFERTGERADLDAAIIIAGQAAETVPAGQPDRGGMLSNLGDALLARFQRTGALADLDAALAAAREAVDATPAGHPGRAKSLSNLAGALQARFEWTGELADLAEAVTTMREAVDATPARHPDRAAAWVRARCVRSGSSIELRARRGDRRIQLRVDGDIDVDVVAEFLTAAFADQDP
jgi:hypothetical protein